MTIYNYRPAILWYFWTTIVQLRYVVYIPCLYIIYYYTITYFNPHSINHDAETCRGSNLNLFSCLSFNKRYFPEGVLVRLFYLNYMLQVNRCNKDVLLSRYLHDKCRITICLDILNETL